MTYEEYKNLLEKTAPDGKFNGGFLAAFELGHLQGIKEGANSNEVNRELLEALEKIQKWNTHPNDLGLKSGSNGVRDFYRNLAHAAIAKATKGQKP